MSVIIESLLALDGGGGRGAEFADLDAAENVDELIRSGSGRDGPPPSG